MWVLFLSGVVVRRSFVGREYNDKWTERTVRRRMKSHCRFTMCHANLVGVDVSLAIFREKRTGKIAIDFAGAFHDRRCLHYYLIGLCVPKRAAYDYDYYCYLSFLVYKRAIHAAQISTQPMGRYQPSITVVYRTYCKMPFQTVKNNRIPSHGWSTDGCEAIFR